MVPAPTPPVKPRPFLLCFFVAVTAHGVPPVLADTQPDRVLRISEPGFEIQRETPAGWLGLCRAPCDLQLPSGSRLRAVSPDGTTSRVLSLDAASEESIDLVVKRRMSGFQFLGWTLVGVGGLPAFGGALSLVVSSVMRADCPNGPSGFDCQAKTDGFRNYGLFTLALGLIIVLPGIVFVLSEPDLHLTKSDRDPNERVPMKQLEPMRTVPAPDPREVR
jgi:hypothetical protein